MTRLLSTTNNKLLLDQISSPRQPWSIKSKLENINQTIISQDELIRMGKLAHLDVSQADEQFRKRVSQMIHFCKLLPTISTTTDDENNITNTTQNQPLRKQRPDTIGENYENSLSNARITYDGYFVVSSSKSSSSSSSSSSNESPN
jgi:Asp-tRNA(Asn)/Glu-tRNA(Gln) amidotransferase C subunit